LDLPDLGLVIHAELPVNKAGLLHRSGRTGRAGRKGVSVLVVPHTKRRRAEQLLASANVEAEWSGAPSADAIRAQDQVRLLADPLLNEAPSPEDLALAGRILADRSPEAVAAALIRLYRTRLPAPEEMLEYVRDERPESQAPRAPRRERLDATDAVWFRLPIGRSKNADPKWLVPLICRLGHVTKRDIGQIRISDRETRFEISREVAGRFREAAQAANAAGDMRVEPSDAPQQQERRYTPGPKRRPGGGPKRRRE
jgi:ATP-dependent RNA helicase DeaD